jgi:putative lipoic acid-binding regulatory protein
VDKVIEQPSRSGKYVSLRMHSHPPSAEVVLDVYEVLSNLDGVLMTL